MANWSFFDWLTYGCIGIAAFMTALDQGVRQSAAEPSFITKVVKSRLWSFTPFGLILISAALLLVRLFFPLSPASAISVASEPPIVAPPPNTSYNSVNKDAELHRPPLQHIPIIGDLKEKSNQDVRKMAYVLNQELTELQINHIQDREKLKGSPNSVAIATLDLDEQLNDDFRQQFEPGFLKLNAELDRRLNISADRYTALPPERIDSGDIGNAGSHLIALANRLP
jgi:hypothetical protein